jgi:hypothetical protein
MFGSIYAGCDVRHWHTPKPDKNKPKGENKGDN